MFHARSRKSMYICYVTRHMCVCYLHHRRPEWYACPFKFPDWAGLHLHMTHMTHVLSSSHLKSIASLGKLPVTHVTLCRSVCVCLVQVCGSEEIQRSCSFGTMQLVSGWWLLEWVKELMMSTIQKHCLLKIIMMRHFMNHFWNTDLLNALKSIESKYIKI